MRLRSARVDQSEKGYIWNITFGANGPAWMSHKIAFFLIFIFVPRGNPPVAGT